MYFKEPYFTRNSEWYYHDESDEKRPLKLTDKAPKKAKKSYEEYCKMLDQWAEPYVDENGTTWITT